MQSNQSQRYMLFKPMKPEDVRKALEGHEDILATADKESLAYFKRLTCPSCSGQVGRIVNPQKPFKANEILANFLGKCESCGIEFEPYTGIQVTMPR